MNEAETRAELIDPKLKACGWGVVEGSKILREYNITDGKIQTGGIRAKKLNADYVLVYKGIKLAVVEAKSDDLGVGEGVAQANLFKSEEELRTLWSNPMTRKVLLEKLEEVGFPKSDLQIVQQLVDMEKSDLFDVLEYVFYGNHNSLTREQRVAASQATIFAILNEKQKEFIEFVLSKYVETGVEELDQEKLPILLTNKYQSLEDAKVELGNVGDISKLFIEFQKHLYAQRVA